MTAGNPDRLIVPRTRHILLVVVRSVLAAGLVALLLAGCSGGSAICAGQCRAPYELDVTFVPGTSIPTAKAVLQMCEHEPDVVRVGALKVQNGSVLWGVVWTRTLGSAKNEPLLTCLMSSPSVRIRSTGWPD
jgi:hypothetical protein